VRPEHSRALRLAAQASAHAETSLLEHLRLQHVHLTLDPSRPEDLAAAELLAANLARLPIQLTVDTDELCAGARARMDWATRAADPFATSLKETRRANALHVHVGREGRADLHAAPVHHGATVAKRPLPATGPASGLGAVTCAALATGEIFKRIAPIRPDRARAYDEFTWCPVTLGPEPESAPLLDRPPDLDIALIGLGAVGTATTRILGLLGATGHASVVDPERFTIENVGTYSLGERDDARRRIWKTHLAHRVLSGSMSVETHEVPVEEFIERIDAGRARWPALALTGLDSVNARREAQMLWPLRLLDAATGDTMCGLHDVGRTDRACLRCLFPVVTGGPNAAQRLADRLGIDALVLRDGDQPLRLEHIAHLDENRRHALLAEVGKPICGLAQAAGLTELPSHDYRPSVPFVSQQAACLAVGRLVADELGLSRATFVQYDTLTGPDAGTFEQREPLASCYCQQRVGIVARLRAMRSTQKAT
jgi:hypothetical protein